MRKAFTWITAHPWLLIFLCILSTAVFGYGLTKIKADATVENMMPTGHPSVEHAKFVEEVFQIDSSAVIAVVNEGPDGIYNPHSLKLIYDLTEKLAGIRGIDPKKIWSIFTVSNIVGEAGGFAVVPLSEGLPEGPAAIESLRARVRADELIFGTMVAKTEKGSLVYAAVTPVADKAQVYYDIQELLKTIPTQGETIYVTGEPVVQGVLGKYVNEDMRRMMPIVSVLVILMLVVMFRSMRGLVLPLAGVIFCVVWAMGLMALVKIPIYPMTTMIPILLMAMGVAYGIHIIARYFIISQEQLQANPNVSNREIVILTMMELWSPLIMASTTDAAGFLSLLTSKMKPVFYTGVFTSFGLLVALLFSLVLIPAALSKMKKPSRIVSERVGTWEDRLFGKMGVAVFSFRKAIAGLAVVVFVFMLLASRNLIVDSDPMSNFNQDDPIPRSSRIINKMFGGTYVINTTLEAGTEKRFLDPDVLTAIDGFQTEVKGFEYVGATASLADFLKSMHRAMNENDQAFYVVPPTRNLIGTYLMLYSGENIDHYINYNADKINIEARITTSSTKELEKVIDRIEKAATGHFGKLQDVQVKIGGHARVMIDMLNFIVYGQVYSIFLSMLLVFIITSVMFRSPVAGLFTSAPICLATAFNFGVMALLRIPLEPATAITACIGIGVGVDYGIHFIAKYQIMRQRGFRGPELVQATMASAGKSIFFNAAVVIGGFLVLVVSAFPPTRHMGFMVSLNMFTSYVASVTLLPALLAWIDPAFIQKGQPESSNQG